MKIAHNGTLMRIYLQESARYKNRAALGAIVEALAAAGIAGATAFKGIEGFGASGAISPGWSPDAWVDLPILVEVVDEDDKIRSFLPLLETILDDGLVTLERVETLLLRTASESAGP
jgi:PII-like signaling protein